MSLASKVVTKAASQIGVKESPAGSNRQKYGRWYGLNGEPWCAIFVTWVFSKAGAAKYFYGGKKVAYCPYVVDWAKKAGVWHGRDYKPVPGDVILYANKGTACHIGIVEKRIDSQRVQTIEGNTSAGDNANGGQVQRRIRSYGEKGSSWYILGFVHPHWSDSKEKKTKASKYTDYKVIADGGLNCRKGAGKEYPVTRILAKGKTVHIRATKDGWGKTKTGDWCCMKYLKLK